jgi:hypothetical protein
MTLQSYCWCQVWSRGGCLCRCRSHGASPWVKPASQSTAIFLWKFSKVTRPVVRQRAIWLTLVAIWRWVPWSNWMSVHSRWRYSPYPHRLTSIFLRLVSSTTHCSVSTMRCATCQCIIQLFIHRRIHGKMGYQRQLDVHRGLDSIHQKSPGWHIQEDTHCFLWNWHHW